MLDKTKLSFPKKLISSNVEITGCVMAKKTLANNMAAKVDKAINQ
jgi:hypothetical protein